MSAYGFGAPIDPKKHILKHVKGVRSVHDKFSVKGSSSGDAVVAAQSSAMQDDALLKKLSGKAKAGRARRNQREEILRWNEENSRLLEAFNKQFIALVTSCGRIREWSSSYDSGETQSQAFSTIDSKEDLYDSLVRCQEGWREMAAELFNAIGTVKHKNSKRQARKQLFDHIMSGISHMKGEAGVLEDEIQQMVAQSRHEWEESSTLDDHSGTSKVGNKLRPEDIEAALQHAPLSSEEASVLKMEFLARFEQIDKELVERLKQSRFSQEPPMKLNQEKELIFQKILKQFNASKQGHLVMLRQLSKEGGFSLSRWGDYVSWFKRKQLCAAQSQSAILEWKRQRNELTQAALIKVQEMVLIRTEEQMRARERDEWNIRSKAVHARLDTLREEAAAREAEQCKLKEAAEQQEAIRQGKLQALEMKRRSALKEKVVEYKQLKADIKEFELRSKEQEEKEIKQLRQEMAPMWRERVEYRKDLIAKKLDERQASKEQEMLRQQKVARQLEHLVNSVKPDVERDTERAAQKTASVARREEAEADSKYFPVHGYKMDTLLADTRFKLGLALRDAGLDGTEAARKAMATVPSSLLPRKDMFTSDQLGYKYR